MSQTSTSSDNSTATKLAEPPRAKFPAVGVIRRINNTLAIEYADADRRRFLSADGQWFEISKRGV